MGCVTGEGNRMFYDGQCTTLFFALEETLFLSSGAGNTLALHFRGRHYLGLSRLFAIQIFLRREFLIYGSQYLAKMCRNMTDHWRTGSP